LNIPEVKKRIALFFIRREVRQRAAAWLEGVLGRPLTQKENKAMSNLINAIFGNWRTTLAGLVKGIVVGVLVQHLPLSDAFHSALGTVLLASPFVVGGMLQKDAAVGSQATH
jgi:hypothetical protein